MIIVHGDIHNQERDVNKFWKNEFAHGVLRLGRFGLENQTAIHPDMAFRIIGYDGATYHEQSRDYDNRYRQAKKEEEQAKKEKEAGTETKTDTETSNEVKNAEVKVKFTPVPVWSYVLYFGVKPWKAPKNLSDIFDLSQYPQEMQDDFQNYGYKVIQVDFSTEAEINSLQTDFKYVAIALVEYRKLYEERAKGVCNLDLSKLKEALEADLEYKYEVYNLIWAILQSDSFGREIEDLLKKGGCKLFDYIADEKALTFWEAVYDLMESEHISEAEALQKLDSTGGKRIKYRRPVGFPKCFVASA